MKRIRVLVLALMLLSCLVGTVASADVEHDCGDTNGDCKCDICGVEFHGWWSQVYDDESHWFVCACGFQNTETIEPHNISEYGSCYCGYGKENCPHPSEYLQWDITVEEHSGRCQFCSQVIVEGSHTMVDGACSACGFTGCAHVHINWEWNQNYHEGECAECGVLIYPHGPHKFDENGVCVCSQKACIHGTLAQTKDVTLYFNETKHWYVCNLCGYLYYAKESHTFADGKCTFCGAEPCAVGTHIPDEEYPKHLCIKCGMSVGCQDKNGDCVCDYCDNQYHTYTTFQISETDHIGICVTCGAESYPEPHYDEDDTVGCDICGYGTPRAQEKVEVAENTPAVQVQLPAAGLLTAEEMDLISSGVEVEITLSVHNADATVTETERALVTAVVEQAKTETTVALYLNIDLTKAVGTAEKTAITETEQMVLIVIDIPEELQGDNRKFTVIRVHEGEAAELQDLDNSPETVTIQTDRFSTYALAYTDVNLLPPEDSGAPDEENESETKDVQDEDDEKDAEDDPEEDLTVIIAISAIAVCAAVIVAVLLIVQHKKKQ